MSTVPVFAPNGDLGDIPAERVAEALKAGFQVGVNVQSADGQPGVIPAHRTADAVKAGMKIVPIAEQPSQHPGALSALGDSLWGMLKNAAPPTTKEGLLAKAKMLKEAITGPDPKEYLQNAIDRMNAGRGPAYASVAGMGQQLGADVPGMEQSARQGDVGGVLGHAAALPLVMGTGMALGEFPLGRLTKAAGGAGKGAAERLPIVGPIAKGAIRGAAKSWRESAPVETPATYPGAPNPTATPQQLNPALFSQSRTLPGMNPPEVISRPTPTPGPIAGPSRGLALPGQVERPMPEIPPSRVSTTQPKATPMSKADVLARARAIAQQPGTGVVPPKTSGPQTLVEGQPVPADTDLTSALQKSIPQKTPPPERIQGKIMQELREQTGGRDLTVGIDKLMESPRLKGYTREQVEAAAHKLGDSGKVWKDTVESGPQAGLKGIALRKK